MPQTKYLLPKSEKYYKANLHTHTNVTDGALSPEEIAELYKAKGYSILSITDHNVIMDMSHLNEKDFLMLTGAEYNIDEPNWAGKRMWTKSYHLNFIAKRPDNLWQPYLPKKPKENALPYLAKVESSEMPHEHRLEDINAIIAEANKRGFLVAYNHPTWSLHDYTDYAGLEGLWATEIINGDSGRGGYGDRDNSRVFADLLNLGNNVFPVAADDSHSTSHVGNAWVMIGAERLEYGPVISALEKGDFYASNGPEIYELSLTDKILHVQCSDAQSIVVNGGTRFAKQAFPKAPDKLIRTADIDIGKWIDGCTEESSRNWIRVTVYGPYGQFAATRAFRIEELR